MTTQGSSEKTDMDGFNYADKEYASLINEWKESRLSIDRFDKITVDLRKYGFSITTRLHITTRLRVLLRDFKV